MPLLPNARGGSQAVDVCGGRICQVEPLESRRLLSAAYTIADLGAFPSGDGTSSANAINAGGEVAGASKVAGGNSHPFLYANGVLRDLTPSGGDGTAMAINDSGQVAGKAGDAFLYSNGTMQHLGTLPGGNTSFAYAINNSGQIAGDSLTSDPSVTHAFLFASGHMQDLGTLGGSQSNAFGMNNSGQVVGLAYASNGVAHAFLYSNGHMQDIGQAWGPAASFARAINDAGQIVGYGYFLGIQPRHAFLYSNGKMTDLQTLGGVSSAAWGINSKGQIVGDSNVPSGADHAFIYDSGRMQDLNALIDSSSGWVLQQASGINASGQIAGTGVIHGKQHAFLLTPVPPSPSPPPNQGTGTGTQPGTNGGAGTGSGTTGGTGTSSGTGTGTGGTGTSTGTGGGTTSGTSGGSTGVTGGTVQPPAAQPHGLSVGPIQAKISASAVGGSLVRGASVGISDPGAQDLSGTVNLAVYAWTPSNGTALGSALTIVSRKVHLRPGRSMSIHLTAFHLPSAAGTYYLVAGAALGVTAGNSAAIGPVTVAGPFVDLAGRATGAPTLSGNRSTVSFTLANNGNVPAKGNATADLYVSATPTLDNSAILVASVPMRVSLQPGRSRAQRVHFVPTSSPPASARYLLLRVRLAGGAAQPSSITAVPLG